MHQYKTILQTLLVLSVLNVVFAAPVVPQEVRDTGKDVAVVAEDVTTLSERRRGTPPGGTTPSEYSSSSSSDGSPPQDSLPLEGSAPLQGSAPLSWSAPSSHLSATDRQVPAQDSTTEASTSAHPLSAAEVPAPVPDSNTEASTSSHRPVPVQDSTAEGSPTPHYTAITPDMLYKDPNKMSMAQKIGGFAAITTFVTAIVLLSALGNKHGNNTGG
jgi:hypothetical protein